VAVAPVFRAPQVGSLVQARGRDWVVLPSPAPEVLQLRPLTGSEEETIGLYLPLGEPWATSAFAPPDPATAWDVAGGRLLLDAARLALRDGAAPFRSLGRVSVTPRPYQFVPLIMALRLEPVRLLIADDVGVGKTIEAGMIARELLDRGIARRLGVICPAHLTEQWERELREKFGIQAAVIQPSSYARLERELPRQDLSVYGYHRHLIASVDFVKSGTHRTRFLGDAPDLIIVDEAHTCARPRGDMGRGQHQRYDFVREIAADRARHLLLVTATPHSGIEESFRSLLGLLDPAFDSDPHWPEAPLDREALLPHVVQRERRDLTSWPGAETPFPERDSIDRPYALSPAYLRLFDDVLAYCRESIQDQRGLRAHHQRVRHWAAIALLRCVLSSPRAAASVLARRGERQGWELAAEEGLSEEQTDDLYRDQVLDAGSEETLSDYVPAAPLEDAEALLSASERRRLAGFLKGARALEGPAADLKLAEVTAALAELLAEGFRPIVFCRFIPTAHYLAEWLPKSLAARAGDVRVGVVTGEIGDEERRSAIGELVAEPGQRVLVATDCISEGINLQEGFDAVVHYDLPWNPNRIEQREGRVDRFGQQRPVVKRVLIYGANNPVDQVVLDVLIRKAERIRTDTGIAVPVPDVSEVTVEAAGASTVLLRAPGGRAAATGGTQLGLGLSVPEVSRLHESWDAAAAREKGDRRFFAQRGIKPAEVARELEAADPVLGDAAAIERFLANALQLLGGELRATGETGVFALDLGELAKSPHLADLGGGPMRVVFDRLRDPAAVFIGRTHPIVTACTEMVLGRGLSPASDRRFPRCGALLTDAVQAPTGIALLRFRYVLREAAETFAEEVVIAAFEATPEGPRWLQPFEEAATALLARARPAGNLDPGEPEELVAWALRTLERRADWYAPIRDARVEALQAAHARLRKLTREGKLRVVPHEPPDILALYTLAPGGRA
jgi:superfamily II DNA or RNA helicase